MRAGADVPNPAHMGAAQTDIAILGGGLAGGLVALALAHHRPEVRVALFDRGHALGGNHVWSFFASDLPDHGAALIAPLIAAQWQGYDVRFPRYTRTLDTAYCTTTSDRLDAALRAQLPAAAIRTGVEVTGCTPTTVHLAGGEVITAGAVIDARGISDYPSMTGGWQKFLGQRLKLTAPHGLTRPIVMDATVPQIDGYRFVYCLPFAEDEIFVEDTYYADGPALDRDALAARVADYAAAQGWQVAQILAEEQGVLPVVAGGDYDRLRAVAGHDAALAGTRAGLFHPLTSYSLPDGLRFALALAAERELSAPALTRFADHYARRHWRAAWYYRKLTALLFAAAAPDQRYRVMQRFYGLKPRLIERFYAGQSTAIDRMRILAGVPPLPVGAAIGVLTGLGARPRPLGR